MRRFFHSRAALALMAVLTIAGGLLYASLGPLPTLACNGGLVPQWSAPWPLPPLWALGLGLVLNMGLAYMLSVLNKIFNLLRCMTFLQGTIFLCMQMATPALLVEVTPGIVLAEVVLACSILMFASYNNPDSQRSVFLVFFLLSACSTFDDSYLIYMPVFLLACGQMRIFSLRTLLALLMGIATPWILLFGFGIVEPSALTMPQYFKTPVVDRLSAFSSQVAIVALTAFLAVSAWIQSVMKFLTYNAQSRAMLSMVMVITLFTILALIADFGAVYSFLPLLNCCAALQLAHLFGVIYTSNKSYIAIISLILIYLVIYLWRIVAYFL